jgi:hypothetical protein
MLFYEHKPLTETKEYNLLGTVIDHKGCFKRGIQELSKKGLKGLFSLQKLLSNFEQLPVNLSCKLFNTLIRPILRYNCEIWYMDEYLFVRINTNNINPLIKKFLNVDKSLYDEGFYTWYTLALNVFQEFDLDAEDFANMDKCFHKITVPFKKEFKKVVHNNYIQKTKDKLSKLTDNSKLYLYNKIKHDIVLEEYLIQENFLKIDNS